MYTHNFRRFVFASALALVLLFCVNIASAAIISGSTYDISLQKESNVIIEINTSPRQMLVSKFGDYTFNVKPGNYSLYAHTNTSEAVESLSVVDDGNYTLDVVLGEKLTYVNKDIFLKESNMNVSVSDTSEPKSSDYLPWIVVGLILAALILVIALRLFKERRPVKTVSEEVPLDEYEHKLLRILKKEKRATQKDLRKELPLSEAKISLIISDLESKGKIRKIKKGRGNIIIFVKE